MTFVEGRKNENLQTWKMGLAERSVWCRRSAALVRRKIVKRAGGYLRELGMKK